MNPQHRPSGHRTSLLALPFLSAATVPPAIPAPVATAPPDQPPSTGRPLPCAAAAGPQPGATTAELVRLAIDIGADTTTAVLQIGAQTIPIRFDFQDTIATPRADDDPQAIDIKTHLAAHRETESHPVYQAFLRQIADHAAATLSRGETTISQLLLTLPPTWGPHRRDLVRRCAAEAGLPDPVIVSEAAAAAQATVPDMPEGAIILVCDLGTRGRLTVLRRTDRGWNQLATHESADIGGRGLDAAMAVQIAPDHCADPTLLARCAAARAHLVTLDAEGAVAIVVPDQPIPTIFDRDDLSPIDTRACTQLVDIAHETLAAAEVPADQLTAVVVRGGASNTIQPADELADALKLTPFDIDDPHLLCRGALALATPPPSPAANPPAPRRWLRPGHLATIAVPAILGSYLATQEIDETYTYTSIWESYRDIYDYEKINAFFDRPAFALAAWCLSLSAIAGGALIASLLHQHDLQDKTPGAHARTGGRILVFAVIAGAAVALTQAMLAYTVINGPSMILPNFAGIVAAGIAVPSLTSLGIGLLAPLSARLRARGWADRLQHPATGVGTAVCGTIAGNLYFDHPGPLAWIPLQWGHRLGVLLLAIAIAVTLFTHRAARTILAVILGFGGLLATSNIEISHIVQEKYTVAYLIVVALWWIRRTLRIGLDALPDGWLRQTLTGMTTPTLAPAEATATTLEAAPPAGRAPSAT
jgi:hypothetical protein